MTKDSSAWTRVSDSLGELAGLLLGAEPPNEVLHRVAALATRTISSTASCSVSVTRGETVETVAAANELSRQLDEMQYTNGDGPCLEALREGTAVYAAALPQETRWGQYPQLAVDHGVLSMLSLPLAPQGKTIGALNLYATVAHAFDDGSDRALCELFAGQAGVTVAGSQRHAAQLELSEGLRSELDRLLERDRQRAERVAERQRRLEILIDALTAPLTEEQVGQVVVDAATSGSGAACGALLTRTGSVPGRERLELRGERNLPQHGRGQLSRLPLKEAGILAYPLTPLAQPVVVVADELPARDPQLADLFGERSLVAVALRRGADAVGVLVLAYPAGGEPDSDALGFLLTVAQLAAAALERARLAEAEQASARRLALLARASTALVSSVARNQALPTLDSVLVPDLADWAAAHLVEPDGTLRLADVRTADPAHRGALRAALTALAPTLADSFGPGLAAREQRPALYPDVTDEVVAALMRDPDLRARVSALHVNAVAVLPLIAGGATLGTVTLARTKGGFDPADIALAQEIANRAAVSLDNTRLYAQAADAALTLQRALLPVELPEVPGITTAARYLPGTAGLEAGGDFYDVIALPHGRVGLAIGDVMGHGVAAAAVMGQLRAALRAYALEDHAPAALLTRLNTVVDALGTGALTTCTYAVYNPAGRQLQIATAGHLPPLLSGPGQPTRYLNLDPGLPLGVGDVELADTTLTLPPLTTLVLCTDGLVETRQAPLSDGLERLARAVDAVALPPEQTCDHVLHELSPPDPSQHADDIALLVATTRPA